MQILLLVKKELKDLFISPIGYIVIGTFLAIVGIIFSINVFVGNQADMRVLFDLLPAILLVFVPAVTMRSWAEERKEGTLEILATQPISSVEIIVTKILSNFLFISLAVLLTITIPITLNLLGNPDNGVLLASYIGLLVIVLTYVNIGQLVSINTKNQVIAFIISVVAITVLFIISDQEFLKLVPRFTHSILSAIGISSHFESIIKGVIDTRDMFYFLSLNFITTSFIYLSINRIKLQGK